MMFTLLDHLLNGVFIIITIAAVAFAIDMGRYVFGGDHDES